MHFLHYLYIFDPHFWQIFNWPIKSSSAEVIKGFFLILLFLGSNVFLAKHFKEEFFRK